MLHDSSPRSALDHGGRRATPRNLCLLIVAALIGASVASVAWICTEATYTAEGNLWIELPDGPDADPRPFGRSLHGQGWIELLRSYRVLESVVREHRLQIQAPEEHARAFAPFALAAQYLPGTYELRVDATGEGFELVTSKGALVQQGVLGEPIGKRIGFRWSPPRDSLEPGAAITFTVLRPREAAETLSEQLRATAHGNVLSLGISGPDPQKIADVLDSLMEELVAVAAELRARKIDETLTALESRREQVEQALRQTDRDLEVLRSREAGGSLDEARLERRLRSIEDLYSQVLQRVEALRLARASLTPDVLILDGASVPERPSEDPRMPVTVAVLLAWLAVVAGSGLLLGGRDVRPGHFGHDGRTALRPCLDEDVGPVLIILGGAVMTMLLTILVGS